MVKPWWQNHQSKPWTWVVVSSLWPLVGSASWSDSLQQTSLGAERGFIPLKIYNIVKNSFYQHKVSSLWMRRQIQIQSLLSSQDWLWNKTTLKHWHFWCQGLVPLRGHTCVKTANQAQRSAWEDHGIWSHHFVKNRWGNSGNSIRLYFLGLQNHGR